ncbi:hypothetical protein CXG81DRAFT_24576 [Caulochytrium protostelioides]|uniref:Uncharacterized protein n=1 Tax=Caulochytrium protostelioides TaxID=1555241 RepID=A0A4P9XBL2_9FUNG|nr:hypothetical protein CXG81DRAFT_24576 [Caulochytrium protostelioides]|eukprot:RKP02788.1 hypothetical protein CXG81DRAFT_24576 [Caulochytrium protostelioides]
MPADLAGLLGSVRLAPSTAAPPAAAPWPVPRSAATATAATAARAAAAATPLRSPEPRRPPAAGDGSRAHAAPAAAPASTSGPRPAPRSTAPPTALTIARPPATGLAPPGEPAHDRVAAKPVRERVRFQILPSHRHRPEDAAAAAADGALRATPFGFETIGEEEPVPPSVGEPVAVAAAEPACPRPAPPFVPTAHVSDAHLALLVQITGPFRLGYQDFHVRYLLGQQAVTNPLWSRRRPPLEPDALRKLRSNGTEYRRYIADEQAVQAVQTLLHDVARTKTALVDKMVSVALHHARYEELQQTNAALHEQHEQATHALNRHVAAMQVDNETRHAAIADTHASLSDLHRRLAKQWRATVRASDAALAAQRAEVAARRAALAAVVAQHDALVTFQTTATESPAQLKAELDGARARKAAAATEHAIEIATAQQLLASEQAIQDTMRAQGHMQVLEAKFEQDVATRMDSALARQYAESQRLARELAMHQGHQSVLAASVAALRAESAQLKTACRQQRAARDRRLQTKLSHVHHRWSQDDSL